MTGPTDLEKKQMWAVRELLKRQSPEDRETTLNYIIQKHMEIVATAHGIELSMQSPEWLEKTKADVRKALIGVLELG